MNEHRSLGKQDKFMKLLEPELERLEKYCLAMCGDHNEAKDLLSETILQSYRRLENLKDLSKFPHYTFRIAKRLHWKRSRNSWSLLRDYMEPIMIKDPSLDAAQLLDLKYLHEAISRLPEKLKQAVVHFEISGFSMKEISEIENCSLSAAKARVARGRQKLARMLVKEPESQFSNNIPSEVEFNLKVK